MVFKISLFCLLLLGLQPTNAQFKGCDCHSMYEIPGKIQSLYNNKNYKEAAELSMPFWRKCKEYDIKNELVYITIYNAACCWGLINGRDSAFKLLNDAIKSEVFLPLFQEMQSDGDLQNLHSDPRWTLLLKKGNKYLSSFKKNVDSSIVLHLQKIRYNDQKYRTEVAKLNQRKENAAKIRKVWKLAEKQDSADMQYIADLIKKNGWPGPELVGFDGNKTIFLVIQHAPLKTQLHYLPLMKKAVKKKLASPGDLAFLEDRILIRQKKKQRYGTQLNQTYTKAFPIKDSATVDCRRFQVGLVTMERYINNW